jgi:hypothetical protein
MEAMSLSLEHASVEYYTLRSATLRAVESYLIVSFNFSF